MRNDVRLYINDQEIEFSADPKILLNYKEVELHKPTIVRNSYTKQITVEGTGRNNDIFGHIWNLERVQNGSSFNPIKKTDFQLFVNDELFQKGYCKLDKVTRTNNMTQYSITLYGGLGSFFYNLTYDQADSGNNKKTLASLNYAIGLHDYVEPDLDFTISKETVNEAWNQLTGFGNGFNDKWDVINFIPALNGIPNDFDAAKVLINNNELGGGFRNSATDGGVNYLPTINGALNAKGYSLGEVPEDLQEWQTRDLRSYNQRPCISMYRIIQACCNPSNNGGYQVKLDNHFFNVANPYYYKSWVTMPLLKDLDGVGGGETFEISGATLSSPSTQYRAQIYSLSFNTPAASLNNVNLSISLRYNPNSACSATSLYQQHFYESPGFTTTDLRYVREMERNTGVVMQMFALGQSGEIVGQSKAYLLAGSKYYFKNGDPMWKNFWNPDEFNGDIGSQPEYEFVEGYFKKINGNYVFCNKNGKQTNINFSFTAPTNFTSIILKVKTPSGEYIKYGGRWPVMSTFSDQIPNSSVRTCYSKQKSTDSGNHTLADAYRKDEVPGDYGFVIESFEGVATDYEGLFSGTKITKERLLTGEYTPADYLLSYCKMFGLYFYYDSTEESDDPDMYPAGVVHIMDRDTFYTDEVVDLSKMIDWDKKMDITPAMASAKWYRFDTEHVDSELETGYKEQFGKTYGSQLVNTNYNFDSNTTDLYDGNVFKSAIMCLEKDKYYKKSPNGLPVYQYNGMTYNLFHRNATENEFDTYEIEYPVTTTMHMYAVNQDYDSYDAFPKLQFHGEDNTPTDGSNVLVFFKGSVDVAANYWLTDDINEMITLNDASPCWILTNSPYDGAGTEIAKKVEHFPYFTRDLIITGLYGNITHSWNFGHPQVIYSPDTFTTDMDSIYDVSWRDYIRDLYDVDTRKLTCYVRAEMDDKPWPYWLRRFYWFENSIWMLNEIKDLNPASFDTTKMEFIKVQDMNNYKLTKIEYHGSNSVSFNETNISCDSGTVTGTVYLQTGGRWDAANLFGIDGYGNYTQLDTSTHVHPESGSGFTSTFTVTVPQNTGDTIMTWTVAIIPSGAGRTYNASFTQETCNTASTLYLTPASNTVYSPASSISLDYTAVRVSGLSVSSNAAWATPTISGNKVVVSYTKNTGSTDRTAVIQLTGTGTEGAISASATIVQKARGSVTTNKNQIVFDWNETGEKSLSVWTNDDWTSSINDN